VSLAPATLPACQTSFAGWPRARSQRSSIEVGGACRQRVGRHRLSPCSELFACERCRRLLQPAREFGTDRPAAPPANLSEGSWLDPLRSELLPAHVLEDQHEPAPRIAVRAEAGAFLVGCAPADAAFAQAVGFFADELLALDPDRDRLEQASGVATARLPVRAEAGGLRVGEVFLKVGAKRLAEDGAGLLLPASVAACFRAGLQAVVAAGRGVLPVEREPLGLVGLPEREQPSRAPFSEQEPVEVSQQ
jgi:hypothetical protein